MTLRGASYVVAATLNGLMCILYVTGHERPDVWHAAVNCAVLALIFTMWAITDGEAA
jgi:hypothetical protein